MKIKKIFAFLSLPVFLLTAACSNDHEDSLTVQDDITLSGLTVSSINLGHDGSPEGDASAEFSVKCEAVPLAVSDSEWLAVNRVSSANKIHTFSVSATANNSQETRTGTITVTAGKSSEKVSVTQSAAPAPQEPEETQPSLGIKALDIARDIRAGWNIGNTLEAIGGETAWGNPRINARYIAGIKAAGFNAVRIPCAWDQYITDTSNQTIDPQWLERVNEVVKMVLEQDLYAIVNIHWDGGWLENNIGSSAKSSLLDKQKALWTQIAKRLCHFDERLMFAGLNEPNADEAAGSAALLQYEQAFIDAVRATGGNNSTRTLIFQGPHTDITKTSEFFKTNPSDPAGSGYLMAEIHYYDPYQYTIMEEDASWGLVSWFWGNRFHMEGSDRNAPWGEEDWMKQQFDLMKKQFVDKDIPVIIGEYGAYPEEHYPSLQTAEQKQIIADSRAYFYSCVQKFGKERGLIPFVWDTGELINRTDGSINKQYMIDAIIQGSDAVSYPY